MPRLVAIVGPTAIGKTDLALRLADCIDIEVVSADSRQIYRGMDIGTAKPTAEEQQRLPHHLLDVVDPDQTLTLAEYQELAYQAIDSIVARGKLPLLVGGSGLYVWAVIENWRIPRVPPQVELRQRLEQQAAQLGAAQLHRQLTEVDPVAAANIHPHNIRRVIRALEVYYTSGEPISRQQQRGDLRYRTLIIGLTAERHWLYARADERVEDMLRRGLIEETQRLLLAGYSAQAPAMSGLGYRQIVASLRGEYPLSEAVRRIKTGTHRFIRQQYTWFRNDDTRIHWQHQPVDMRMVLSLVTEFLASAQSRSTQGEHQWLLHK
ncbi:MAG: tRNA (adenosine(37)-N6)-dimethylallyltransferase MiaA [Anaerolineae bacterium]